MYATSITAVTPGKIIIKQQCVSQATFNANDLMLSHHSNTAKQHMLIRFDVVSWYCHLTSIPRIALFLSTAAASVSTLEESKPSKIVLVIHSKNASCSHWMKLTKVSRRHNIIGRNLNVCKDRQSTTTTYLFQLCRIVSIIFWLWRYSATTVLLQTQKFTLFLRMLEHCRNSLTAVASIWIRYQFSKVKKETNQLIFQSSYGQ